VIGIDATDPSATPIGRNSIIYLNTDQDKTTGFSPFGGVHTVGAEFEVVFGSDSQPYLYSVASDGTLTLQNGGAPLTYAFSSDSTSVELAIPQSLLTPVGRPTPAAIDFDVLLNTRNGVAFPPPFFSASTPEYIIPDPAQRRRPQPRSPIRSPSTEHSRIGKRRPPRQAPSGDRSSLFNPATDPSDWAALTATAAEIPLTAILNPNTGPRTSQDLGYVSAINASPLIPKVMTADRCGPNFAFRWM
jgi:hypothetical protein